MADLGWEDLDWEGLDWEVFGLRRFGAAGKVWSLYPPFTRNESLQDAWGSLCLHMVVFLSSQYQFIYFPIFTNEIRGCNY